MKRDWLFKGDNYICSFRSVGVLIRANKILVQRDKDGSEYALPGGHVVVGETAEQSLVREYKEETGTDIICNRLIWVEECFWEWNKKKSNTLAFYYLIDLCEGHDIQDDNEFHSHKDNCDVILGWVPLEKLKNITIYPTFIKEKIYTIQDHIEHFVTKE